MLRSPPSRRRGLKSKSSASCIVPLIVASFAEAWIEIVSPSTKDKEKQSRLLRGGVD